MINLESWQKVVLAILISAGVGYAGGRYVQPAKVVTKIKEVTKTVQVVKHDTVTVVKEVTRPDGSKESTTTITDHDVDTTDSSTKTSISQKISNEKPQWKASGLAGYNFSKLNPVYGAQIERRIIGPIFVGAWGNTDKAAGVALSIEF